MHNDHDKLRNYYNVVICISRSAYLKGFGCYFIYLLVGSENAA